MMHTPTMAIGISAKVISLIVAVLTTSMMPGATCAEMPNTIAAAGETPVATFHAEGAQIYECAADASGTLAWRLREPIATLLIDNTTVGRHYAGPSWELADGSILVGKIVGDAPGATAKDIPLLKLDVMSQRGPSHADVTTIQRLNTKGGVADGPCEHSRAFLSVPYSADYALLRKARWSLIPYPMPDTETHNPGRN